MYIIPYCRRCVEGNREMDSRYAERAGVGLDGGAAGDWAASRLRGSPRSRGSVELAGDGGRWGQREILATFLSVRLFHAPPGAGFSIWLRPAGGERAAGRVVCEGCGESRLLQGAYRERRVAIESRRLLTGREIYVEFGISSRGSARFVRSAGRRGGVYGESSSVGQSTGLWIQGSGVRVPSFTLFCVRR